LIDAFGKELGQSRLGAMDPKAKLELLEFAGRKLKGVYTLPFR
jgi:hypothetical protein